MACKKGAQKIRALEPCSRVHVASPLKQGDRLTNKIDLLDALYNNASNCCYPTCCHRSDGGITLSFPVSLSLSATASGAPDLQIQLFHLQWGCLSSDAPQGRPNDPNRFTVLYRQDGHLSAPVPHPEDSPFSVRDPGAGPPLPKPIRPHLQPSLSHHSPTPAQYLSSAGAVLLFTLLQSDLAAAWGPSLVLPGLAVAAAEVAGAVSELSKRRRFKAGGRLMALDCPSDPDYQKLQQERRRWGRPLSRWVRGAGCVGRPVALALQRIMMPTALLSLAGRAWRTAHASSAALAEAVVDLLAVGLSYSCLAREAQLGRLPQGPTREAAWRRCHKVAAQRLAHHLGDLPPTPPLGPSLAALQRCSIAAGLSVHGRALCGVADALAPYRAGGGGDVTLGASTDVLHGSRCPGAVTVGAAGRRGRQLMLSMSYCHKKGRSRADSTAMPGVVAAQPGSTAAGGAVADSEGELVRQGLSSVPVIPVDADAGFPSATTAISSSTASTDPSAGPHTDPLRPHGSLPDPTPYGTPAAVQHLSVYSSPDKSASLRCPPPSMDETELLTWSRNDPAGPDPSPMVPHSNPGDRSPPRSTAAAVSETPGSRISPSKSPSTTPCTASANHSPSAAVRRGLPRAASASSLRALPPASLMPAAALAGPEVAAAAAVLRTKHLVSDAGAGRDLATGATTTITTTTTTANGPFHTTPDLDVEVESGQCASTCSLPSPSVRDYTVSSSASRAAQNAASPGLAAQPPLRLAGRPVVRRIHEVALLAANWIRNLYANGAEVSGTASPLNPVSAHAAAATDPVPLDHGSVGAGWQAALRGPLTRSQALELMQREQAEVEALGLPLYGRADHVHTSAQGRPMGLQERLDLVLRAAFLAAAFLTFLTLGLALLLVAALLGSSQPAVAATAKDRHVVHSSATHGGGDGVNGAKKPSADQCSGLRRGDDSAYGGQCAAIDVTRRDSGGGSGQWRCHTAAACRRRAWRLLLSGVRRSGAAFIKWGQWAATRVDIFPDDFCEVLSELHDRAPTHSFEYTKRQVESSFGVSLDMLFETFDPRPVASGSIAQVHRAHLRCADGSSQSVAVKVVHPGVERRIRQDFTLLHSAASLLGRLPSLRGLSLSDTVSQFSASMTAQADMRVEAAHLRRFYGNFTKVASQVTTPRPLPGLVRRDVLVESWEGGDSVAAFIRQPGPLNTGIVCLGVDTYLKMLLQDNFVHTDLHPGNIMVRMVGPNGNPMPLPIPLPTTGASGGVPPAACGPSAASPGGFPAGGFGGLQLVLLDFGMAEELSPAVRHHFISLLHHLMRGDGAAAASHLLRWTSRPQACPNPAALTADMEALAATSCSVHSAGGMDLDAVMKTVLRLARQHQVTIDSAYASLVVAVCVIVGFASSLDPRVNLVDAAVPALLAHALTGRVVGRLYS